MVPYCVKGDLWIGYDDEDSVRTKVNSIHKYFRVADQGSTHLWKLNIVNEQMFLNTTFNAQGYHQL